MMSVAMMAIGAGNGTSKANAIDFDWANGHKPALSAGSWYRVSLSPLKAQANDPTLALYLTNLTDETAAVSVTVEASLLGQSSSSKFNYNIAGKDYQLWSKKSFNAAGRELSLKQMMDLGLSEIYLQLTANKEIALSAKVYETEDIVDDACSKAKDFDWAGVSVQAGEQWYRLNLTEVKSQNKQLKFVVANNGVSAANVAFDMSLDCPASAVIEKDWVIAAGAEQKDELGRVFLDVMNEDYVFVKLTTNQPLTLSVEEEVVVVDPDQFADFDCASAPELVFDEEMNLTAGKHVYKVRRAELIAERDFDTEFHVTNNTDAAANLAVEVAFACPVKSVVTQNLVINAHESIMKLVKGDMLKAVNSEWVYIRFVADQDLTATVGMRNVSPCVNALPFDWNVGAALNAGESQWYDMDITSLKQNKQHVRLSFTNHSDAIALVNVEVALDCNGTILPITLPIPAGLTMSQVIDYQLLARSPLNRIYVGVSTDSHIELAASTKDAIAADPTPCLNAINPVHGVEYTHEANTTQWYKISLDLLKSTTDYSSIYLANKGNSRAHVTIGMVTDCQYTTGATLTIPVPAGLEIGALAPNVLGRLIQELARFERAYNKVDAKDVYLEIHSDQPLAFGLDVVNQATNPCLREDLITFDWNKGDKVVKGEPKWFDLDIDAVKAAGKHVKLTFTNHTDSLVWAATVVSAECPAKLTMPLLVPVPAGMSVDKVINYQLFAVADIHNIYIGVMTDGALELKAESTDATIIPPADCLVAKTIVSGEEFVQQPGTQWYQFPMSLIDEMGDAASISFKNMTSKHATLTTGVTTSCEYAAATVAKVKVPRDIEFTLNMPKVLISKVRGLIDPAIANFYLQLTTDQAIAFTLNTQATGVNACASAVEFDWTAWETDGLKLEANKEQWYKVNIAYPLEKLKNGEDITLALSNPNLMPVEVDLAVSPTCPVVLSLEKSVTVPAKTAVSKTISYDEVMKLLAQYDKYDLADRDFGKLMEQINVYVLYNKLTQLLTDRGYDKYLPLDKIEPVVNKYGEAASLANLKELVENYDKYLSVAELKSRLEPYKEKVSIETLLGLIDKYGHYIPKVDAQKLIDNADALIPYIGTANVIVNKCKQYISKDDLKKLVERIKSYVPFEEMKKLAARLEKYLPEKNTFYVYVKASGDLEINPGAPIEPDCTDEAIETTVEACDAYEWHGVEYTASGDYTYIENVANCEDAEWLDWKQPIKLSEFTAPWYKLDVSEIIANESDFSLTLVNDLGEAVQMPLELHYYCSEDGDGFIASDSREIAEGTYTREIPYALFDEFIGPEYETIYLHNVNADCDRVEVLHLTIIKSETTTMPIEYATICEGETYDWRGNTYSVSDTIVVEEALECGKAIHTLKLDVINGDTVMPTEYMTICEGKTYEWRGNTYSVSDTIVVEEVLTCGTATYTLVLDVINGDTTIPTEATICEGETYEWRGNLYNVADTYTETVVLECGTATYTLVLTVKDCSTPDTPCEDETVEYWVTQCDPYEWYGQLYDQTADYTRTSTTPEGCTLTEILHLTIDCPPTPPTPEDPCANAELVQWNDTVVIPAMAAKMYKVDVQTLIASGKDVEMTLLNGVQDNTVDVKYNTQCFIYVPKADTLIYELNGGVTNEYGWQNKNDMFQAFMADCGVSGLPSLDELKNSADPFVTICSPFMTSQCQAFLDNPNWDWLEAYIMQVQNADVTTPAIQLYEGQASAGWRYAVAAFFLESQRTGWPRSADFSVAGQDAAYFPAWQHGYANPTKAIYGYELSAPYKAGYSFAGWYKNPDFSGEKVTVLSSSAKGNLYAKWIEYVPTIAEVKALGQKLETKATGVVTFIDRKNVYIQDLTGGILLYMKSNPELTVGQQVVVKGRTGLYGGAPELDKVEVVSAEDGKMPEAIVLESLSPLMDDMTFKYYAQLVSVPALTITDYDSYNNPTFSDGIYSIKGYKMVLDPALFPVGTRVSVTAVAAYYNGYQFQGDVAGIQKVRAAKYDTYAYPERHGKYNLTNNWVISNVEGNYSQNSPGSNGMVRGMAAKDGIMYFINRETKSLVRVDGATGEMLMPLAIQNADMLFMEEDVFGGSMQVVTLPFNDIHFDDAGNCLIGACITNGNQRFIIYELNLETGVATEVINDRLWDNPAIDGTSLRFDAFGVKGDIHKNACIMAADASGSWDVYRWLITDGTAAAGEQLNMYVNDGESLFAYAYGFGTAPRIAPVDESGSLFYVDGFNTLPMLFSEDGMLMDDFINCSYGTNATNNPGDEITLSTNLNGVQKFKVGDEYFLLVAGTHTVSSSPSAYALYKFADANCSFSEMEPMWYFPNNGLGSSTNGSRTSVVSVDVNGNTATIYLYSLNNGYASYSLTIGESANAAVNAPAKAPARAAKANAASTAVDEYYEKVASLIANEERKVTITAERMRELGIEDYVYVFVETNGELTVWGDTIDTPVVPECENTNYEFTDYFCGAVMWDGVIYDQPGDYTHKYWRADGCYDVYTMHLIEDCTTPCTPVYTEFDAVFCGEYNWNGTIYTAPGDYEQTLTAVSGCDSIVTMHLTEYCPVTPECENVYTEFSTTFCETFTWNGVVYTEAGDYVQTLSKTDGCDSIVTLHLTEDCVVDPINPTPEIPGNPCLDAIPFDWTTGAFLAAGEAQWYEMDITSLIENEQHLMLNFINHSDENAWINVVVALDCEGQMVPMMLPVLANMNVDQTIDYQILKRSPLKRIYVGVYTKEADIELKSAVRSAIATDQTPCSNATEVQYNETYVHEPGTSWYKVSVDLLKNESDALGFYFSNKGNKHAHVTVGMVADCQYTTGTTITLPIPTGLDLNVIAPNLLKKLMQEVESFEEKFNEWDVQEIYMEVTTDQTIEFALKAQDGNYACESAIDFDWVDWETNGIQLQADQDVWYRVNMEYPIEKLLREEEIVVAITNFDTVAVDVEMTVSPTCPVVVSVDKAFSVPARTAVKKTLSYADAMQWLSRHDAYLPYDQIQLFVDKYGDHLSVAELKNMLNNYEKYISVEQLKQELAKHIDYIGYENVEAALNKYGKFIPYVDAEALLKKFEDELVIAAGYAVVVLKECDPYITAENFWQVVDYCKPYIPVEELKHLLEIVEKHLTDYTCYLRVKTTGDLYVGPKPLPIPCDDVLVEETVEACGQYEWKGVLYTVSGDYTFTQPLADPANAEFLDWKQPIKLSEFTEPWYKVDVTEVIATHSDFTLLIENDLNETQEVTLALHDAMAEFLLSGSWKVATGVHPKTVTFEEFEQIVDPEHKVLYLHNVNYDCERTEVLHLTIKNCDETITAAVCDGTVYVDPITNVEHLISSLVPSTLTWTETVLTANKEKTTYTYVITPIVAPAALTAEVLATIPGATPVLTPGLMPNVAGTAEAIKAYYESIDTESISDVVTVSWETAAVACGATSHTMTLVVEDDCDNIVKAEITLEVAAVEPVEETVTACDSYEWNGTTYTASGDYTYTTTNANGCDSVVILHLTINQSEIVEETVTACDSYEWHGTTYTTSGDYTFTTVAANGCDRIEILHLTINQSEVVEETVTACDSYEWHGQTYTESGDYTFNTVAANGCDRTEILHLTINKSETVEETVTACDSYVWHGQTYTTSGDYTFTTVAANGCDRIEILHLTINKSETVEETITACDSYVWNGQTYTESGTYTYTTVAANGCDRIEILHLTINESEVGETTVAEICPGDSYSWNGENYDQAGTYTITMTNAAGCDSTATLVLSIPDPENSTDHAEIAAISKYGGRLLVLDLNVFTATLGFTPAPEQVKWYELIGDMDAAIDAWDQVGDDKFTGVSGYYYNLPSGDKVAGRYYALIEQDLETLPCSGIYRSVVLSAANTAKLPMLAPNVVSPEEDVRVLNLDSSSENAIRVYNMTGDLMATFNASYVDEFAFKAASFSGYYVVEIENAYEKVTLRYIVK